MNKHPLDVLNERLLNGYYNNLPQFSYSLDVATTCYLLGYCSKVDYELVKFKYDFFNNCDKRKHLDIL